MIQRIIFTSSPSSSPRGLCLIVELKMAEEKQWRRAAASSDNSGGEREKKKSQIVVVRGLPPSQSRDPGETDYCYYCNCYWFLAKTTTTTQCSPNEAARSSDDNLLFFFFFFWRPLSRGLATLSNSVNVNLSLDHCKIAGALVSM